MSLLEAISLQATKEAILETCAIIVADLESGEIYYATAVAERLLGYLMRGELRGMNVDQLVPLDSRKVHKDYRAAYALDQRMRPMGKGKPLLGLRKNATTFPVAVGLHSAVIEDKRCVIVTLMDLTPVPADLTSAENATH